MTGDEVQVQDRPVDAGRGNRASPLELFQRFSGAVLCTAAVFKTFSEYSSDEGNGLNWLLLITAGIEFVVGLAIVGRLRPKITIPAASLLFTILMGVAGLGTARGVASCHCFGAVQIPPPVLLTFDLLAVIAFLPTLFPTFRSMDGRAKTLIAAHFGCLYFGILIGLFLYPHLGTVAYDVTREALEAAKTVMLRPNTFRGKAEPLLDLIQIDADLTRGRWTVILARAGCPRCERELQNGGCLPKDGGQIAVIFVKDKAPGILPRNCPAIQGTLDDSKIWDFQAPLKFQVADGRFVANKPE